MLLKETGLTAQDIKEKVDKYMIETYERFDFVAETAKDMYVRDEKGQAYLDFYAGIAVNSVGRSVLQQAWTRFFSRTAEQKQMKQ